MDDIKSSHKDKKVQDDFEEWLIQKYDTDEEGKVMGKMKRCTGKRLEYLGMVLDFKTPGQVSFHMQEYVEKMISDFEDEVGKVKITKTPAAEHIFTVRQDGKELKEERSMIFHNASAKALYLCKRARPDIQVAVAF